MIATPWGRADELGSRKLRPGPGASREEVRRNQCERLYGAMVAAVAEHGYDKTRVADLLEISGISRNTFYRHFGNKRECFLATLDAIVAAGGAVVVDAYERHEGAWHERLGAGLRALVGLVVEQPAAARLYYVDSYAAGPEAIEKLERMGDRLQAVAQRALAESSEHAGMPDDLLRAILLGLQRVIQTRLRTGHEADLVAQSPDLLRWALGYTTPPQPLRHPRKPSAAALARIPAAEPPHDARDRIVAAVVELIAENGYGALRISDIAERAAISLSTFYAEFAGKEDAVLEALRRATGRVIEATAPAYRDAPDWPHGVGAALHAFFAFMTAERPFARFGGVDTHLGSRLIVEVRDQLLAAAQVFLSEGYRQHPDVPPIAGEAIGAAVDSLLFDQVLNRGAERLYEAAPTAAYLALVPFVGAERACAIANEGA